MIRVLFFDLGQTLVDASDRPFPHATEAVRAIQGFVTTGGRPLATALVSDFDMPVPPPTPQKVRACFDRYLAILETTGLRPLFEPVARRVTISAHAGVYKPDRRIFDTALARLRTRAALDECLFITEDADHVRAARATLHMHALQFRSASSAAFDFDDWTQAPAMVAHLMNPDGGHPALAGNDEAALGLHLRLAHGFDVQEVDSEASSKGRWRVRGAIWRPVGTAAGQSLDDVRAPFPSEADVTRGPSGEIRAVRVTEPTAEEVREAAALVRSLARHGQLEDAPPQPAEAATHAIVTDDAGRRRLVRKRVRAF